VVDDPVDRRTAFTPLEFCARNGISLTLFNKLVAQKLGPKIMQLGTARRVTLAAEAAWQRARENPSAKELAKIEADRERRKRASKRAGRISADGPNHISKTPAKRRRQHQQRRTQAAE
jgi:hypothetical protein